MTRTRMTIALAGAATLLLSGCGQDPADRADNAPQSEQSAAAPTPVDTPLAAAAAEIPLAMHGRWGLVPLDCEPGRADAKGLMVVSPRQLEFYESVGRLASITQIQPTGIRASFDFSGEGMTWQREMALDLQDAGAVLIRREFGDEAAPDPLRYSRCP